jgi:aerobic carbon-monoxide dehydrogenase small subunit
MVIAAEGLLRRHEELDEDAIRHGLAGNLCRCTGYAKIVAAVLETAERRRTAMVDGSPDPRDPERETF